MAMASLCSSGDSGPDSSDLKPSFHASLSRANILEKIFSFLPMRDVLNCRLVCDAWQAASWTRFNNFKQGDLTKPKSKSNSGQIQRCKSSTSLPFHRIMLEPIVDHIVNCLPTSQLQCQSRLINQTFNYIVKQKLSFTPVLTDYTKSAVLFTDQDVHVTQLTVKDLYMMLPQTSEGHLDCNFNRTRVKSVFFYEGVSTENKRILLRSFPRLNALKYIGSSSFVYFKDIRDSPFHHLQKLHIKTDASNDMGGNLVTFLNKARFPVLKKVCLDFYFRMDFFVYFESHNFIGNHCKTLKDVTLKFSSKCDYHPPESVNGIAVTYTPQLVKQFSELSNVTFNNLQLDDLSLELLPYEGTSLFILGFALAESQKCLRNLRIYKEYTYTRNELLPLNAILQNNARTLVNINIPHPYVFNCTCIQHCKVLESLYIGEVMYSSRYVMMFSDSDVLNIMCLPRLSTLTKLKLSIRLTSDQLEWILTHYQLTELYFNGHQSERYTCESIKHIICLQVKLTCLGFNCDMDREQYDLIAKYCRDNEGIIYTESVYGEEEFYVALGESRGKFQIAIDRQVFNHGSGSKC